MVGEGPEDGTEHVRAGREIAFAESVPDFFGDHFRHGSEAFGDFREDGCTGGGDEFVGFVGLLDGDAVKQLEDGGGGDGEPAVSAVDPAVSVLQFGGEHPLDTEGLETDANADDIGDGIEGTDFVEVDVLGACAVDFRFGECDAVEDGECAAFDAVGEIARFNHRADVAVGPVRMLVLVFVSVVVTAGVVVLVFVGVVVTAGVVVLVLVGVVVTAGVVVLVFVSVVVTAGVVVLLLVLVIVVARVAVGRAFVDGEADAGDVFAFVLLEVHVEVAEVELREFPFENGRFEAECDECAECHVSADAGETIEEECFHGRGRFGLANDGCGVFQRDCVLVESFSDDAAVNAGEGVQLFDILDAGDAAAGDDVEGNCFAEALKLGEVGPVHHSVRGDVRVDHGFHAAGVHVFREGDCGQGGGFGPSFHRYETVFRIDPNGDAVRSEAVNERGDEVDGFCCARADDDAADASVEGVFDGLFGAHTAAHLNGDGECARDFPNGFEVLVRSRKRGVEIDDVEPVAAFRFPTFGERGGVVGIHGFLRSESLLEADDMAVHEIDGGVEEHDGVSVENGIRASFGGSCEAFGVRFPGFFQDGIAFRERCLVRRLRRRFLRSRRRR